MNSKKINHLDNYKKNGWVVIPGFFSKLKINQIKVKVNNYLRKNYKKYEGRDINFVGDIKKFSKMLIIYNIYRKFLHNY